MSVVGTAGHVDHGKSTLLRVITGRDPDRWDEEKRRGLTIDLGFVWTTLPSGREVSFVDVPGHERFIKNMLAGIEAIDVALFVVAADEGWMPQSEEHLAVLDLLGVRRGVVALTKTDRVDDELVELATLEILDRLEGTSLSEAPVIPVSAPTGRGVDELIEALDDLLPEPEQGSDPRLWIDRRFTAAGAGTVVTGTLLGGPLAVGDTLVTYPGEDEVRVRTLESHEEPRDHVEPHRRVAAGLVGAPDDLDRGAMLGRRGRWRITDRFTATLRTARYVEELTDRGAFQVHMGSAAVPARLRLLDDGAVVTLARGLPARYGDRFILRETGRRAVVGGGQVLDPSPPRRGKALRTAAGLAAGLTPVEAANALLDLRGSDRIDRLEAETGDRPTHGLAIGSMVVTQEHARSLEQRAVTEVDEFHGTNPLRPGIPAATLASRIGAELELVTILVETSDRLETDGNVVWRVGHSTELSPAQQRSWEKARSLLASSGLSAPRASELPLDREVLYGLIRSGDLIQISEDLVYLPETVDALRRAISAMPDGFTVADFRDALEISRKYAVPILEWSDREGLTRRRGDLRSPLRVS